jgi:hypothetical protein
MTDKIVENVREKYLQRSKVGINKYGTTLEGNNKDNYLEHLQQELMDATLYLEKLMSLEKELTTLVNKHKNDAELGYAIRRLIK